LVFFVKWNVSANRTFSREIKIIFVHVDMGKSFS
jgi:hypothetical protein